jgi:type IV secretory pathway TraG/TraD family ATPase VirD4
MFQSLAGLYIDKHNRIFTTEQYPGRVQMFRYFTDDEAREQIKQHQAELEKKRPQGAEAKTGAAESAAPASPTNSAAQQPQ